MKTDECVGELIPIIASVPGNKNLTAWQEVDAKPGAGLDDITHYACDSIGDMVMLRLDLNLYLPSMAYVLKEAVKEIHLTALHLAGHPNVADGPHARQVSGERRGADTARHTDRSPQRAEASETGGGDSQTARVLSASDQPRPPRG